MGADLSLGRLKRYRGFHRIQSQGLSSLFSYKSVILGCRIKGISVQHTPEKLRLLDITCVKFFIVIYDKLKACLEGIVTIKEFQEIVLTIV